MIKLLIQHKFFFGGARREILKKILKKMTHCVQENKPVLFRSSLNKIISQSLF